MKSPDEGMTDMRDRDSEKDDKSGSVIEVTDSKTGNSPVSVMAESMSNEPTAAGYIVDCDFEYEDAFDVGDIIPIERNPAAKAASSAKDISDASLHPAPTQNTCSSPSAEPPTANPVASDQLETQLVSVKTPPITIILERIGVLKIDGVIPAVWEEKSMISPIIMARVYVDADIIADATIGFAMRSRAHPVKTASGAVVTSDAIDADLVLAVYNRHIVVVSSSRMWDPGGSSKATHHTSVQTARSRLMTPAANESSFAAFRQ
jgi:hypothetical protein